MSYANIAREMAEDVGFTTQGQKSVENGFVSGLPILNSVMIGIR
jgi:hypothetical protein